MSTNNTTYSGSITLVKVSDGLSADSYYVETNYDEILRFTTEAGVEFSPPAVRFRVLDLINNSKPLEDFSWNFSFMDHEKEEFVTLAETDSNQYIKYFQYTGKNTPNTVDDEALSGAGESIKSASLTFYIQDFYTDLKNRAISNNQGILEYLEDFNKNMIFKFVYIKNGKAVAIKIISCQNGVSADMAQLHIGAAGISAAIREASLKFDATGLSLQNGDFRIIKNIFQQSELDEETFNSSGKQYYYLDDNGTYRPAKQYIQGAIYFEKIREEPVLYTEDNNLAIKGNIYADNGYFKGRVEAIEGSFSGTINSTEGSIGGFLINGSEISSKGIKLVSALEDEESYIQAGKIFLEEAYLQNKLIIQSEEGEEVATLYNPFVSTNPSNLILKSGQIMLTSDGHFSLGKIDMYAGSEGKLDGYIRANWVDEAGVRQNGFWRINEDGTAYFDEIYLKEAHIQNSILEINTVQSVGSMMIFKDSWSIIEVDRTFLKLKGRAKLEEGDWLYSGENYYQVAFYWEEIYYEKIIDAEGKENFVETEDPFFIEGKKYYDASEEETLDTEFCSYIELTKPYEDSSRILTKFGKASTEKNDEPGHILSIFGEKGNITNKSTNSFAIGNSLTISSFSVGEGEEPNLMFTKHLILGNLNNTGIDVLSNMNGWGLYCDNVFLKGSLVTRIQSDSINSAYYSGINTASTVQFAQKPESLPTFDDSSNIIFWSGAKSIDEISKAPFQVSARGTLYAQDAIIVNSTFSGSIHSSEIHTAKIFGEDSGLTIYDSAKGISFKSLLDSEEKETYSIKADGLWHGTNQFILIPVEAQAGVVFQGTFLANSGDQENNIWQSIKITEENVFFENAGHESKISLKNAEEDNNTAQFCLEVNNGNQLIIKEESVDVNTIATFTGDIWFGTNIMQYKKVDKGYDIYVYA